MQITWIAYNNVDTSRNQYFSPVASARYRLIIPARALEQMGYRIHLLQLATDDRFEAMAPQVKGDAIIFSKLMSPDLVAFEKIAKLTLELAQAARTRHTKVIADISDDHFARPVYGEYYKTLVNQADLTVASTPKMAEIVRHYTSRPVLVAGDPFEGVRREVKFAPPRARAKSLLGRVLGNVLARPGGRSALRPLWFGYGSNLDSLVDLLPELHRLVARHALELNLVTSPQPGVERLCTKFNEDYAPVCTLRFSPWSIDTTWQALSECDLVIIPVRMNDPGKLVKSPNRLIEAIWAGRFVVANPIPSYQEFGDFAWLGDNIVDGIEWAVEHPGEVRRRIAAGQEYIARSYAPETIAQQWDAAVKAAMSAEAAPRADRQAIKLNGQPVKLNLGCGDKILPGYINVDIAESRGNFKPDVLCDLHRLTPFTDNTVEEVLSVHVVEHFWRWEVVDVLREWVRVLKPGGKMILECPNLLSACKELLRNPDAASGPGAEGQRTMWVFYGDPAWQDPLMIHRWGYTPRSLAQVMSEAGLVNIRQEPAQFKLREPRDMRIVGEKPE